MSWQRWPNVNITVGQIPWRDFNEVETAGREVRYMKFSKQLVSIISLYYLLRAIAFNSMTQGQGGSLIWLQVGGVYIPIPNNL